MIECIIFATAYYLPWEADWTADSKLIYLDYRAYLALEHTIVTFALALECILYDRRYYLHESALLAPKWLTCAEVHYPLAL
jgi:hypothetical protein